MRRYFPAFAVARHVFPDALDVLPAVVRVIVLEVLVAAIASEALVIAAVAVEGDAAVSVLVAVLAASIVAECIGMADFADRKN
jgi:hypothetical protein